MPDMVQGMDFALILRAKGGRAFLTQSCAAHPCVPPPPPGRTSVFVQLSGSAYSGCFHCRRGLDVKAATDASWEVANTLAHHSRLKDVEADACASSDLVFRADEQAGLRPTVAELFVTTPVQVRR